LNFDREHAPSIIFMDEIDSIGSARMQSGSGGGDSEVQRTMLELLNQLDGFEASNKIKVLMATNRMDILDQALLRPGRIDRKIEFPNPNEDVSGNHFFFFSASSRVHATSSRHQFFSYLIASFSPAVPL
jgi:ATP-dependent 26S proteasome regulatory subunit